MRLSDWIIVMHQGAKIAEGTPRRSARQRHRHAHLSRHHVVRRHAERRAAGRVLRQEAGAVRHRHDAGRAAHRGGDRPERRRQVDGAARGVRARAAARGHDPLRRPRRQQRRRRRRTSRPESPSCRRARACSAISRCSRTCAWAATRSRPRFSPSASRRCSTRFRSCASAATQTAGALSGGERQMLAFGMALMLRPRLLLIDEPSIGLAPMLVAQIFDTIVRHPRRIRHRGADRRAAGAADPAHRRPGVRHSRRAADQPGPGRELPRRGRAAAGLPERAQTRPTGGKRTMRKTAPHSLVRWLLSARLR